MNRIFLVLAVVLSMMVSDAAYAGPKKVYLVNGLLSKLLGYGLTNLSKKMPYARHFKFAGGVTQGAINGIIADAERAYKKDPTVRISLVGISQGANAITKIAAELHKRGVQVHYLGVIEGGSLSPINSNVRKVDNFICTNANCSRTPLKIASGNNVTQTRVFNLDTGHVDSGNHPTMHNRVMQQVN